MFGKINEKTLRFMLFFYVFAACRPHVKKHSRLTQKLYIIYSFGKVVSEMMFPAVVDFCFNSLTFLMIPHIISQN